MPDKPNDPVQRYRDRLSPVIDYIRENPRGDLSVDVLARVVHFSPFHFHRVFTAVMGETVGRFVQRVRLERAIQLMKGVPGRSLSSVATEAGFGSLSDFSRTFRQRYGIAPSRWDRRTPLNQSDESTAPVNVSHGLPYDLESMIRADNTPLPEPELKKLPRLSVAYIRVRRPFEPGALARAYERLREWLHKQRMLEDQLLGLSWDDVEVTPLDQIRYDLACTVPAGTPTSDGVSGRSLPRQLIVTMRATGKLPRVARVWDHLYKDWLPRSTFEPYNLPPFEWYRTWPETMDADDWDLDCCIPLKALEDVPQDSSNRKLR